MDNNRFLKTAFFALTAIAFISIVSMFFMQNTGAFFYSQPREGYCRCLIGPSVYGVGGSPYGSQNMEFKGFTTYAECVDICNGRHSWRQR